MLVLCVLGALLMLFPQMLLGTTPGLSTVAVTDPGVQRALSNLVRQYNRRRSDTLNYFKVLRVVQAEQQVVNGKLREYHIKVTMLKTICLKQKRSLTFKSIQKCETLPGSQQITHVYFILDVSQEH
ncbi:cystatin-1-like [Pantherophis guttatus]|uniref:Cystatin-1-like n=1 Tax=Pantherophis guttatus TaxID=94885 RepID=A0ABM3YR71_PANGU|nr:cystatin-1-like [Pantherophis guttatus]